ncbi:MAG TPA: DNA-binding response regulator, partial [Algoriphagus sp.]|nr:DNA-binding response regulator [Algoriphagus sp.]
MKKRVFLVDDENLALKELQVLLQPFPELEIIGKSDRAQEAII